MFIQLKTPNNKGCIGAGSKCTPGTSAAVDARAVAEWVSFVLSLCLFGFAAYVPLNPCSNEHRVLRQLDQVTVAMVERNTQVAPNLT